MRANPRVLRGVGQRRQAQMSDDLKTVRLFRQLAWVEWLR